MKTTIASILIILLVNTGCKKEKPDSYDIDTMQSIITWKGATAVTENTGSFSVGEGYLTVKEGKLLNSTFNIPVNSINVTNLPPDLKQQLTQHLLSPDFFNALLHPMVVFKIQKTEAYTGVPQPGTIANANTLITGSLTMLGETKTISFPAIVAISSTKIQAEAILEIDRTHWGMTYAAHPALGNQHIYPLVKLNIKLVATKD